MKVHSFVPYIPESAPFTPQQRGWLNGFLAGIYSHSELPVLENQIAAGASGSKLKKPRLVILYGSQTGNAEGLAKQARKMAQSAGFEVELNELDAFPPEQLPQLNRLIIITSTYGEGDPPDNAQAFHTFLLSQSAPRLPDTQFCVFGLGDTNYPDFCQTAKDIDARLEALGAQRILPRVDCDTDFDKAFNDWQRSLLAALQSGSQSGTNEIVSDHRSAQPLAESLPMAPETRKFSRKNPFIAPILRVQNLNGVGSKKATFHIELTLENSGMEYSAGDALGVLPLNHPARVMELIQFSGLSPGELIPEPDGGDAPLSLVLRNFYDIMKLHKPAVQCWADMVGHRDLQAILSDEALWKEFCMGREIIDVLMLCKPKFDSASDFVRHLKPLSPRLYSISSSPLAHPGEVHLTVGHVQYQSHGRQRAGVCSDFLARSIPGQEARVFVQPNKHFRPPHDPSTPLIMVGPGTGIAPFRAFLEERAVSGAAGRNWLFFGDQHAHCDFLYQDQIEEWLASGLLTHLDTAFSRDQKEKVYVQHKMLQRGKDIFRWLEEGACFCVCGDAARMAKDVDSALHSLISTHGHLDPEATINYVSSLKQSKRYLRDVY